MKLSILGSGLERSEREKELLSQAELIVGSPRQLAPFGDDPRCRMALLPVEMAELLLQEAPERACVLYGADPGFHSGMGRLCELMAKHAQIEVLPGISSVALLSARLQRPWQDWKLVSAHGREMDVLLELMDRRPLFVLCGGISQVNATLRELVDAELGETKVTAGENLGMPGERVRCGSAAQLCDEEYGKMCVLLLEAPCPGRRNVPPGIKDEAFVRGKVPMTKREVRASVLSRLQLRPGETLWDVGAGTGSISVEASLLSCRVWAVEREEEALSLIRENRKRFGAWSLRPVPGEAPEILEELPCPDAVFIGGSGGNLEDILDASLRANSRCRVCLTCVTLETLKRAMDAMNAFGLSPQCCQIAVTRAVRTGQVHLLRAENPVFLIWGGQA